jgi:hypothetical protein
MNIETTLNRCCKISSRHCSNLVVAVFAAFILTACMGSPDAPDLSPDIDWEVIAMLQDEDSLQVSWREDVLPVIENRCIVCHGCYDAPCQLKLSSYEGLMRGANPDKVYDGSRIRAAQPTRLGIDATTDAEWQALGFHSVLNSAANDADETPAERLRGSVFYRMMRHKQLNPQPRAGLIPRSVTLDLNRKQVCTAQEDMAKFERDHPLWGMPYALPNLPESEYKTIVKWLAQGAQGPEEFSSDPLVAPQIERWEKFLNGSSKREQLVSRYLYEHLFLGHLNFKVGPDREFYRLVRSYTPPGMPVQEIATTRPFDDPGVKDFWYRLRPFDEVIVAKSHVIYELSDQKMARYKQLFFEADYTVDELPGYEMPATANPFLSFAVIPPKSRYDFMLDDARFFIQGFIKGPVCRGQVALNVIEDQFWVLFTNPAGLADKDAGERIASVSDYLQMPSSTSTLKLFTTYGKYWKEQKKYLAARNQYFFEQVEKKGDKAFSGIWDGNGTNRNAALTVFRNFDSAAVEFGLLGDYPETAWIIDFPLFERIHYLLVAGFDVYGNVGHQLNSRLFMDFLRMEAEDNFLTYLPKADRKKIRDAWYKGIREKRIKYFQEPMEWNDIESPISYKTADTQRELYDLAISHLGPVAGPQDYINRCKGKECASAAKSQKVRTADAYMQKLASRATSDSMRNNPDVVYIRVEVDGEPDIPYTLLINKSYQSLSSFLGSGDSQERDPENDTISILRRLSGSYPNFFLIVKFDELEDFTAEISDDTTVEDYQLFIAKFGIRRTDDEFWKHSDWFQQQYAEQEPVEAGVLDLNRYSNL